MPLGVLAVTKEVILECQRKLRAGEDVEDGILRQLVEATDEHGKPYSLEVMQVNDRCRVTIGTDTEFPGFGDDSSNSGFLEKAN